MENAATKSAAANPRATAGMQAFLLAIVLAVPALRCLQHPYVTDNDIWWHLATGDWIRQHHAVPHVEVFSRGIAGSPWHAYSWLFELLASFLFVTFGLRGIVVLTAGLTVAIAAALFRMIHRMQPDFSVAAVLTFVAGFSMIHMETPRPWLFSILAMVLEVDLLLRSRRDGKAGRLLWLPVIFALWANVHIQFLDGLVVLFLACLESVAGLRVESLRTKLRPAVLLPFAAAALVATLVNPYGWRLYQDAFALSTQSGVMSKIGELQAIPFRDAIHFSALGLLLVATVVLAQQRKLVSLEGVWLGFAALVAFRSQRDVWVLAIMASVVIASIRFQRKKETAPLPGWGPVVALGMALLAMVAAFSLFDVSNAKLGQLEAKELPVQAVEFVQQNHLAGPLYNEFGWGGYLLWSLHQPVAIDGRAALYGDQRIDRSVSTWEGRPNWASDPQLQSAGMVIGPVSSPLTQLLRTDARFRLAYEDKLAVVFVAAPGR